MRTADILERPTFVRDVRLFFPEVRRGGVPIRHPFDIVASGAGDALRRRCREIVERPSRVGWRPPGNRSGDEGWQEVRRGAHEAFAFATSARQPDNRHRIALKFAIGEFVSEVLHRPVLEGLKVIQRRVAQVAMLARPVDGDFWAPRR